MSEAAEKVGTSFEQPAYSAAELGALAHLYRGEVYRSTIWRTRLDATTNWAVASLGLALSVTFSSREASPLALLLATDAMPLDWDACRPPTNAFIHSPHSVSVADTLVVVPDQTVKKAIELRHLGAMDFVDAMSDAPDYLYVK